MVCVLPEIAGICAGAGLVASSRKNVGKAVPDNSVHLRSTCHLCPKLSTHLSVALLGNFNFPIFTVFYRFFGLSWEIIPSHSRSCIHIDYLFTYMFFLSDDVLWRNHLINRVELLEEKSILVFPECLEAC